MLNQIRQNQITHYMLCFSELFVYQIEYLSWTSVSPSSDCPSGYITKANVQKALPATLSPSVPVLQCSSASIYLVGKCVSFLQCNCIKCCTAIRWCQSSVLCPTSVLLTAGSYEPRKSCRCLCHQQFLRAQFEN